MLYNLLYTSRLYTLLLNLANRVSRGQQTRVNTPPEPASHNLVFSSANQSQHSTAIT